MRISVIEWLLDADPSIRWQVMRDLIDESDANVTRERWRVAAEGWGARLLDLQGPDGHWGGAAFVPHAWISTKDTLQLLRDLGVDPTSDRVRRAISQVRDCSTWGEGFGNSPFFEGEVEPCINGRVLAIGAYFGEARERLVDRLLEEQLSDGGWNCYAPPSQRSSFHSTICVLEGLLAYETATGPRPDITAARLRGQEYLLERRLFRSRSTGQDHRNRRGRSVRFLRAGTTTSCGAWTTCGGPASHPTSAWPRRSTWCRRSATSSGVGRSKTRIRVRSTSSWKAAPASRAVGTRFERFACCAGRMPLRLQTLSSCRRARSRAGPIGPAMSVPGRGPPRSSQSRKRPDVSAPSRRGGLVGSGRP